MRKYLPLIVAPVILICLCSLALLPPVRERLAWHANEISLKIGYALNPPEKAVFVPQQAGAPAPSATLPPSITPAATSALTPSAPSPTATPFPTLTPTAPVTPLPERIELKGVRYEDQHGRLNYCAPANLSMALSFWGWRGDRDVVGPALKPDAKDKNVMPYEMADYVQTQTGLRAVERVGGDLELLKRLLAAGYPVLVEKGTYLRDLTGVVSWMGHYQVLTGYDEPGGYFIAQDSFVQADHQISYQDLIDGWRAFNYVYLLIYPPEKEAEVMALLGPDADETANYQNTALKASNEIYGLSGIDQYFAWFNRGTNLTKLQDYAGAAAAYDEAFAIYPSIPEAQRPWRMLWYQTGPYFAYFYSGRYYDTLYLADGTLNAMQGDRNLEESYYWRAMARAALGDTAAAIEDFRTSLQYHPGFEPALYQLRLLGVENP
ncbi:MAG: C39 family peptidase [Anaerolineales bacterium]|nr:C39 family peptidase [Anaerolineales bacterium]